MKVTLDLSKLREDGHLSAEEYEKLLRLGKQDTGSLGINILVAFGVIAVSGGLIALLLDPIDDARASARPCSRSGSC